MAIDDLLARIHERIGQGVMIETSVVVNAPPHYSVKVLWKRFYRTDCRTWVGGVWSDWL